MKKSSKARGFTLVELMVAMVIALLAMIAAISLYASTRQTYRVQGLQSRVAEDGRFAMSMLQRMVLQSGFRSDPAVAITSGYLTPVSTSSFTVKFTGDGVNTIGCNGAVVTGAQTLTIAKNGSSLQCGTDNWLASTGNGVELVDFLAEYGTDSVTNTAPIDYGCGGDVGSSNKERDCIADSYVYATALANPDRIVSVRLCVVVRTEDTDSSPGKTAAYKDCSSQDVSNSQTDNKLYRTFRSTVVIRNR